MNDDQYLLANAYFDGELTAEDLRIAETDPDVMSEVDRLRSLRSLLRDTDLPPASVRTAAIAAAMGEFSPATRAAGAEHDGSSVTGGYVTSIRRRRPSASRYLAVAAAIAAIGGVGVVVAGVIGSGSDDESSGADLAISTETLASAKPDLARADSATALATTMNASADRVNAESAPAEGSTADIASAESSSATTAANDSTATAAGTEMSDATEMTMVAPAFSTPYAPTPGGLIEPIADRDQTITTPGQLAGLGVLLADLRDADTLGATPETSCLFDDPSVEIVDTTRYRFPDVTKTVLVALVASDIEGHTLAIDPDSCDVVVIGP